MVSRDYQALSARRAARAYELAERYPAAREALLFVGSVAAFQQKIEPQSPLEARSDLVKLVLEKGPKPLAEEARALSEAACRQALEDYLEQKDTSSPRSFFARVLLQPQMASRNEMLEAGPTGHGRCPRCGHPPQLGCLRREGEGTALTLACSLCLWEWPFRRALCPSCGESDEKRFAYYSASAIDHLQLQVCESCSRYFHTVNLSKNPTAVPDVDEVSALPLDVWARERGFSKLQPNLVGI